MKPEKTAVALRMVASNQTKSDHGERSQRVSVGSPDSEERRLRTEFESATKSYYRATSALACSHGIVPQNQYDNLLKLVEIGHAECEQARLALQRFRDSS